MDFDSPETIRFLARDRAETLKRVKTLYLLDLDKARERYDQARVDFEEASLVLSDVRTKLAPLDEQIAHFEAVANSEDATYEMLFPDAK